MKLQRGISCAAALVALSLIGMPAQAQDEQEQRLRAALASPERSAENKARDEARRPIQVIEFLGIETGMTVLDVVAAGGWYTEVLSAAVGPSGTVLSHNPDFFAQREGFVEAAEMRADELGNVEVVIGDLNEADIAGEADAAISALNLHDMYNSGGDEAALALLGGVHRALKPGGVFGLIDHAGIEGQDNSELHRMQASAPAAHRGRLRGRGGVRHPREPRRRPHARHPRSVARPEHGPVPVPRAQARVSDGRDEAAPRVGAASLVPPTGFVIAGRVVAAPSSQAPFMIRARV